MESTKNISGSCLFLAMILFIIIILFVFFFYFLNAFYISNSIRTSVIFFLVLTPTLTFNHFPLHYFITLYIFPLSRYLALSFFFFNIFLYKSLWCVYCSKSSAVCYFTFEDVQNDITNDSICPLFNFLCRLICR